MPSKSVKQARLMAAAARDPAFAKKVGIPVSVAKEFNQADAKTGILRKKKPKSKKALTSWLESVRVEVKSVDPSRPFGGEDGYWCVVCQRFIEADEYGVIVHGPIPHPPDMTFDEEGTIH